MILQIWVASLTPSSPSYVETQGMLEYFCAHSLFLARDKLAAAQ